MIEKDFLVFEGIDGTGKSTQAKLLAEWFTAQGREVILCRDPGTTALGEGLRNLILNRKDVPLTPVAECLMYMAARAQLVAEVILPALAQSKVVLADRFLLSNVVYQGYGLGLEPAELWHIGEFATKGLQPGIQIILDLPLDVSARRRGTTPDRLEARDAGYFERVRNGFLHEAALCPEQMVVVDATPSVEIVQATVRDALRRRWTPGGIS